MMPFSSLNKFIFILLSSLILFSCKSIQVGNAYKAQHYPGLPNLNAYVKYTMVLKAGVDFEINAIMLDNIKFSKKITEYSFVNLENQKGHKVTKHPNVFKKGTYAFSFTIEENEYFDLDDIVNINYTIKANKKQSNFQVKINKAKAFFTK